MKNSAAWVSFLSYWCCSSPRRSTFHCFRHTYLFLPLVLKGILFIIWYDDLSCDGVLMVVVGLVDWNRRINKSKR
jgi:hypothetical protein